MRHARRQGFLVRAAQRQYGWERLRGAPSPLSAANCHMENCRMRDSQPRRFQARYGIASKLHIGGVARTPLLFLPELFPGNPLRERCAPSLTWPETISRRNEPVL